MISESGDFNAPHFENNLEESLKALKCTLSAVATLTCLYRLTVEVCRHVLRHLLCLTHVFGKTHQTTTFRDITIVIMQQDLKFKVTLSNLGALSKVDGHHFVNANTSKEKCCSTLKFQFYQFYLKKKKNKQQKNLKNIKIHHFYFQYFTLDINYKLSCSIEKKHGSREHEWHCVKLALGVFQILKQGRPVQDLSQSLILGQAAYFNKTIVIKVCALQHPALKQQLFHFSANNLERLRFRTNQCDSSTVP